jgi:hypothetical protein
LNLLKCDDGEIPPEGVKVGKTAWEN